MKTSYLKKSNILFTLLLTIIFSVSTQAQDADLVKDSNKALQAMIKKSPQLQAKIDAAYGYAILPEIKKAGIGIGGAGGHGIVYKSGVATGTTKMGQASIGLQLGAQKYMQLILFENSDAYESFTGGKLKFDAQVSAVAIEADSGSLNSPYKSGFLIYTMADGGLMFSATVAGQKFSFEEL